MKSKKFPAMAESGWLTRSLEQKRPYNNEYPGAIQPKALKTSFLWVLETVEKGYDPIKILDYILQGLIINRNRTLIELAPPTESIH